MLLAAALASASCAGPGTAPSCVAPTLHIDGAGAGASATEPPTIVLPGSFVVVGEWFRDGCDDDAGFGEEIPSTDVELTLEQNGTTWSLGVADADDRDSHYAITWAVESLPADLAPMPAVLRAGSAEQEVYFSIP
jgi:hypothetical protein